MHCWLVHAVVLFILGCCIHCAPVDQKGPVFTYEPPHIVEFSNDTGGEVKCEAQGNPQPVITWATRDGVPVSDVLGLRHVRSDSSLVFPPFRAEDHRQGIHGTVYQCIAANSFGVIGSREVSLRGVLRNLYALHVYDDFVIKGNIAVLRCHIPSFVQEFVTVQTWIRDDGMTFTPGAVNGSQVVLKTGELLINDVDDSEGKRTYRCRTRHHVTGETATSTTSGKIIVTEPHGSSLPRITYSRPYVRATEDSSVQLACVGEGQPVPTYSWMKEEMGRLTSVRIGERIRQQSGILTIRRAMAEDNGKYVCVVKNSIGERRVETTLTITVPLSVRVHPPFQVLEMGRPAMFNCSIRGYPVHSVFWRKDMQPLVESQRIKLLSREVLHINSVQREDKGMYQCFVQNDVDSAQGAAEASLGDIAPVLLTTFPEKTVQPGESISFVCVASGNPLPVVKWTLDGVPLQKSQRILRNHFVSSEGHVVSYLNISDARVEDSGEYRCDVINDVGTEFYSSRLNVYGLPFVRPMGKLSFLSGMEMILRCPVGGYPIESISWHKDGLVLPVNHRQHLGPEGVLKVKNAQKSADEGEYTCIAKNSAEQVASGTAIVTIVVAPVIDKHVFPDSISADEGSRARLVCAVSKGDPPMKFQWLKDGYALKNQDGIVVQTTEDSSILVFRRINFKDRGSYTCKASNGVASANRTAQLIVNVPPTWLVEPHNTSVVLSQSVRLDCSAEGFPAPVITWRKARGNSPGNFTYMYSSSRIQQYSNGTVVLRDIQEVDAGYYLCQAYNGIGAGISKAIYLRVRVPPHFDVKYRSYVVKIGEDIILRCDVKGEQPVTVTWQKGKQPINHRSGTKQTAEDTRYAFSEVIHPQMVVSTLKVAKAAREDSSLFTCEAKNDFGEDETSIQLVVQELPESPTNLSVVNTTSRTVTLRWEVTFNGNSPLTRNIVQYKKETETWESHVSQLIVPGLDSTAIIRGLLPVMGYNMRVTAENAIGQSNPSEVTTITTEEEVPAGPPTDVTVASTGAQSLKVSWKAPKKELQYGQIRGYYVGYKIASSSDTYQYKHVDSTEGIQSTHLTNLQQLTKYTIVVQAYNKAGPGPRSDEVDGYTLETAPPTSPVLLATSTTTSSIHLRWQRNGKDKSAVQDYILHYKVEGGAWEHLKLDTTTDQYSLKGLRCGTRYRLYLTASNSVGTGEPSNHVTVQTKGAAPLSPHKDHFLTVNATAVHLHLDTWQSGGCPLEHFSVQYRPRHQKQWVVITPHRLGTHQQKLQIKHLAPSTEYVVMVTAHSDAGSTQAEYEFATLNLPTEATPVGPSLVRKGTSVPFHKNLKLLIPIIISGVVIIVVIIVVVVCLKRQLHDGPSWANNGGQPRKPGADDNLVLSEFIQKSTGKQDVESRGSYYSSPTRKPIPVSCSGRQIAGSDNHEYAEPYAAVPPPRRVLNEAENKGVLLIQRPPSEGFDTIHRNPGMPGSRTSAFVQGIDVRYAHQMAPLDKCDYSSGSSHSEGSGDKTSSQSSGCRRPYR